MKDIEKIAELYAKSVAEISEENGNPLSEYSKNLIVAAVCYGYHLATDITDGSDTL